jgi:hypothetical protein
MRKVQSFRGSAMPDIGRDEVKATLAAMDIAISDDDATAVSRILAEILADMRKLDELASEEGEPSPGFAVEVRR